MDRCKHVNKNVAIVVKGALEDLENSDHKAVQTRLSLLAERIGKQNTPIQIRFIYIKTKLTEK